MAAQGTQKIVEFHILFKFHQFDISYVVRDN